MFKRYIVFDKPADQGGGEPPADKPKPEDAPGGSGGGPKAKAITLTFESEEAEQKYLDEKLKERLARKERQAEERERKAREEAEAKALEESQQWQKLAEKRQAQIAELEKRVAELEASEGPAKRNADALKKHVEAQLTGVPEHIQTLLARMEPAEQLEWLTANADKLKPAETEKRPVPPTPPAGGARRDQDLDGLVERKLKSMEYAGL